MKLAGESFIGSGLRGGEGAVDCCIRATSLQRRIRVGKTNRGVALTHEGMAVANGRIYIVPEDGPLALFVYPLPW
jgi:hypothetical protein